MKNPTAQQLDWLSGLPLEQVVRTLVYDATQDTDVDANAILRRISPIPDHSQLQEIVRWLDGIATAAESMTLEEVRALHHCHRSIGAVLMTIMSRKLYKNTTQEKASAA